MRDAVEAAAEGAREGLTEASNSRKNEEDLDEAKRAKDRDKENSDRVFKKLANHVWC